MNQGTYLSKSLEYNYLYQVPARGYALEKEVFFFQHCLCKNFSLAMAMGDIDGNPCHYVALLNEVLLSRCLVEWVSVEP